MPALAERLHAIAAEQPNAPAIEDASGGMSYREFAARVARRRDALEQRCHPGSRILILLSNRIAQPIWVLAASGAGLLPVVADPRGVGPRLEALIAAFRPALVVLDSDHERLADGARLTDEDGSLVAEYGIDADVREIPGAFAAIATSGSTGRPKGVVLSNAAWIESAERLARVLGITRSDRALHVASIAHGSGLLLAAVLLRGGSNVVLPRFGVDDAINAISAARASVTFIVPTMLYDLLTEPGFHPERLPSLRTVYYSGGPASPSLVTRAADRWGPALIQDYGLIEAPAPQLVLDRSDHERLVREPSTGVAETCGRPLSPTEFAIRPPLDRNGVGEITLRGPTLMTGYLTDRAVDRRAVRGGVLRTGDLAAQDAAAYVRIVGRTTNVVVTGGRKVSVEHVEAILKECTGVLDAGVIGIPDERWGELLIAAVIADPARTSQELSTFVRQRLAPHERPKEVIFVDALPVGASGKLRRDELRTLIIGLRRPATASS